jgi:formate-dependent nitrite reductase membrane component NrfD
MLIILECAAVVFYIQASHRTAESRASVELLLKGRLSNAFWFGLIVAGLLIPLAIGIYEVRSVAAGVVATVWLIRLGSVLGLFGGLMLRRLVLAAGIRAPLRAAGIEYTFSTPTVR